MGHFRSIGDIFPGIIARAEAMSGFQRMLNGCETAEARKSLIMAAWESRAISDEDTELLIQAYGLETA